jgi:hypothetical protein
VLKDCITELMGFNNQAVLSRSLHRRSMNINRPFTRLTDPGYGGEGDMAAAPIANC